MDLFGASDTAPTVAKSARSDVNLAAGFAEWWASYPSGPRKVAKKQCLDRWARLECHACADHIRQHTEWMKTKTDWLKDGGAYICAPMVYLNQRRWLDWIPPIATKPKEDALAKINRDRAQAVPPSPEIRAKIQALRSGR